jgi:NitT/TauT family transport system ATP-binding protein
MKDGDLTLTGAGRQFVEADTDSRKKLFAEHLVTYVPIMALIRRVLDERPSRTAPIARFRNELEDYMSEGAADKTLQAVIAWARYAELFAYDENAELFSLENPS